MISSGKEGTKNPPQITTNQRIKTEDKDSRQVGV